MMVVNAEIRRKKMGRKIERRRKENGRRRRRKVEFE